MPAYLVRAAFRSHHTVDLALAVNVIHVELDAFTSPPDYHQAAVDIDAWLGQAWRNMVSTSYTVDDLTVTSVDIPGQPLGQGLVTYGLPGARTTADEDLSKGLCRVSTLKSAVPKRYARGRIFYPPALALSNASTGGGWSNASNYNATTGAFLTALLAPHNAGNNTYSAAVYSRTQHAQGNAKPWYTIIGASTDNKQHFLRSRVTSP